MKILLLSPHPFYQDRGTPIAVSLLLRALSERGDEADVVTYHEGQTPDFKGVRIIRIPRIPFVHNIRPGFSWKKVICDIFVTIKAFLLVMRNRYEIVHAVEESVFIALMLKLFLKIPYIYDMDSSMSDQLIQQYRFLRPLKRFFVAAESAAARNAYGVLPVCNTLGELATTYGARNIRILHDISLIPGSLTDGDGKLRKDLNITGALILYIGNLENYQGIDLLTESFQRVLEQGANASLVIAGGSDSHIKSYRKKIEKLGIADHVYFIGRKPLSDLEFYLSQADILVSPRLNGTNTPLKIYSYLHSGKAILATDLDSHRQVLNDGNSLLREPNVISFTEGMIRLLEDESLRKRLGEEGKKLIEEKYTYPIFKTQLNSIYDEIEQALVKGTNIKGAGPQLLLHGAEKRGT